MAGVSTTRRLFGGEVGFMLFGTEQAFAEPVLENAYYEALRLQKIFNFYDKDSELSRLNRLRAMPASEELLHVMQTALKLCADTDGRYDVSKGKEILARKEGKEIETACSYKDIVVGDGTITLTHPDVMVDLGSIAKGYIADKLSEFLAEQGAEDSLIDARGDIIVKGRTKHVLEIQHPRNEGTLGKVTIQDEGVATSGDYNQFIDTPETSHILNQNAVSVTVIAKTLELADGISTALFVMDDEGRKALMAKNPDIKALVMDKDMNRHSYNGFEAA